MRATRGIASPRFKGFVNGRPSFRASLVQQCASALDSLLRLWGRAFAPCPLLNAAHFALALKRTRGSLMKPRVADTLKGFGCEASVEDFRTALAEVKAEMFPGWSDEALIVTRDEAANYCQAVKKRLNAPRLTRPFILTALIGVRKAKKRTTKLG